MIICRIKMKRRSTKHRQLELDLRRHGGARAGAGRKRAGPRRRVPHTTRPVVKPRFPLHVTVRVGRELPGLRNFELAAALQRAFVRGCVKDGFRICQFSIQGNHAHLICEAHDSASLATGMQGWAVRVARGLNRKLGRTGRVFDDRYHAETVTTPQQMRHVLCYVLQNARRHGARLDPRWHGADPFSSAWWFDGWSDDRWRRGLAPADECPVARARTWLLETGWRRHRLIGVDEVPRVA